jgi:pantoate--beta-alanine ligase
MGDRLEGAHRPGHFRGVATVVTKLLSMFRPDRAYFGQKDGQQAAIIRRLNLDLNLGAEIIVCPTVREPDGLALSSRNSYLDPAQRRAAPVVYGALSAAQSVWKAGVDDAKRLRAEVRRVMKEEPLVEEVYYVSVADADTLEELDLARRDAMVSTAVRIGRTRLIDNVILE